MSRFGVTAYTLASPSGDAACSSKAKTLGILISRGIQTDSVSFTDDDSTLAYDRPTFIPKVDANADDIALPMAAASTNGAWQTLCIHGFDASDRSRALARRMLLVVGFWTPFA